jgi:YhcH/YjgK/YiaL family protein
MILDSLDHATWYFSHPWWRELVEFIRTASSGLPDGEYPLPSHGVVARVFSMQTKEKAACQIESHRACVDVQAVLSGSEMISVWPVPILSASTEHDLVRDVRFYDPPAAPPTSFPLQPGAFAVFFPQDAHMTLIAPDRPAPIKKLVAKVPLALFQA